MGRQPTTRDGNWCFHWFVHRWRRHLVPTPVFSLKDKGGKNEGKGEITDIDRLRGKGASRRCT